MLRWWSGVWRVMSSEFERLRESCLKKGELFEDSDFPAVQTSIFYHQKPPFSFVWKRPKVVLGTSWRNKNMQ